MKGKTSHYPRYDSSKSRSLTLFKEYLLSLDGGKKSQTEAEQCTTDVSKFLLFVAEDRYIDWGAVLEAKKIQKYLKKLTDDGIGVDGQIEKLERIRYALSFVRDEFIEGCNEKHKTGRSDHEGKN